MDYRDILGFSKKQKPKKKVTKPSKPTLTDNLAEQFGPLNEWSKKPPTEKRWSKKFNGGQGLTEFEQRGGKDNINEGPAAEYNKAYTKVKKTYGLFWDAVKDFESLLVKKGLRRHAKDLHRQYSGVEKFYKFFFKMMDKLQ